MISTEKLTLVLVWTVAVGAAVALGTEHQRVEDGGRGARREVMRAELRLAGAERADRSTALAAVDVTSSVKKACVRDVETPVATVMRVARPGGWSIDPNSLEELSAEGVRAQWTLEARSGRPALPQRLGGDKLPPGQADAVDPVPIPGTEGRWLFRRLPDGSGCVSDARAPSDCRFRRENWTARSPRKPPPRTACNEAGFAELDLNPG